MKGFVAASLILLSMPALALAIYKPSRALTPETFGLQCAYNLCLDDPAQRQPTARLVAEAKQQLRIGHGLTVGNPKIIVCYDETCRNTFGLGRRAGMTVGTFAIVIAPRGIARHYVAHELIHYWQGETFGNLVRWRGKPWVIEGMAYALSDDPRAELAPPFEGYRQRFLRWRRAHAELPMERLVADALKQP